MNQISAEEWQRRFGGQNEPGRRRVGRDLSAPEPDRSNVGQSITVVGDLPGAPPAAGFTDQGIVIREGEAAPGERWVASDDAGIGRFGYGDGQTGIYRRLQSTIGAGQGRQGVQQAANAARSLAALAQKVQAGGWPASALPGAGPDWARDTANRDALVELEAVADFDGTLTPALGARAGQLMEVAGVPPRVAVQVAVMEAAARAQGLSEREIQRGMTNMLQSSGAVDAIELDTELTNQKISGPSSVPAAPVPTDAISTDELTRHGRDVAARLNAEEVRLHSRGEIDSPLRQSLDARLSEVAELLSAGPVVQVERQGPVDAERALQAWENPNDPGVRAAGIPLQQLSREETERMASRTVAPPGFARNPFDKESGTLLSGDYGVPVLVGRATEPVMIGSRKDGTRRQMPDPAYEREVRDAEWAVKMNPNPSTVERLARLQENPRGLLQTRTVTTPEYSREYQASLKDALQRASGNPAAPSVQEALVEVAELRANPQWQRWDDTGRVKQGGRRWDPAGLGVVVLNPTAPLPDEMGYSYQGRGQGQSGDGGTGVTGVPTPEVRDLDPDGLSHGFQERHDPAAKGLEQRSATLGQAVNDAYLRGRTPIKPFIVSGNRPMVKEVLDPKTGQTRYYAYQTGWDGGREPQIGPELYPLKGSPAQLNADGVMVQDFRKGARTELTHEGLREINRIVEAAVGAPVLHGGAGMGEGVIPVVNQRLRDEGIGAIQDRLLNQYVSLDAQGGTNSPVWNLIKSLKTGAQFAPDEVTRPMTEVPGSAATTDVENEVARALGERRSQLNRVRGSVGMRPLPAPAAPIAEEGSIATPGRGMLNRVLRRLGQ
jgi:hypothetical protein